MKLLICNKCYDVFSLSTNKVKKCSCGESAGFYVDDLNARYSGDCFPIGFLNSEVITAIKNQPEKGQGKRFTAFVIPKNCGSGSV